jgi:hypothetical protein
MILYPIACALLLALQPAAQPSAQSPAQPQSPALPPAPKHEAPPKDQPQGPIQDKPDQPPLTETLRPRLEALTPANPEGYYLLGEEVADQATDPESRQLAEQLYVLAFDLSAGRDRPGHAALQASVCVALADLVKVDHDRRWLIALARTLDPRRVPPEWLARQAPATTDSAAYQVATVMGLVRSGDGGTARQLLQRPEVKAAFEAYDRLMVNIGITGGASGIIREADRWPCPECQNERIIKKGNTEPHLCSRCQGDPGPALSGAEFIAQLRFESLILQGSQRSWAAQVASDSGAPLMDPDAGGLAAAFDVDPTLSLFRGGRWVIDPNAPPRPKPALPAPPPPKPPAIQEITNNPTPGPN